MAETKIRAVPTQYKGIQMRSRLEAHWACMFDEFGWSWEYEPCIEFPPLKCGRWIPDFKITPRPDYRGNVGDSILVEVKPADSVDELPYADGVDRAYRNASAANYDLLIVGPKPPQDGSMMLKMGIYAESDESSNGEKGITETDVFDALFLWAPARSCTDRIIDGEIIAPIYEICVHEPRLSGLCLAHYLTSNEPAFNVFDTLWATAKNASQWRSPADGK